MNPDQLAFEKSVARATGEELSTISSRGFQRHETPVDALNDDEDRRNPSWSIGTRCRAPTDAL